ALLQDDCPQHPLRILRRLPEVVLLLAQGQRVAVREVARDLHVREPPLVERGVLELRRLEPDARAFDDGPVHRRTTLSRAPGRIAPAAEGSGRRPWPAGRARFEPESACPPRKRRI